MSLKDKAEEVLRGDEKLVTIDLPDNDILRLALEAHRRDITLNQLLLEIIRGELEKDET